MSEAFVVPDSERDDELFRRVEALADCFSRETVSQYVEFFSEVIARELGMWAAEYLRARYERIRAPEPFSGPDPGAVFVLSRVTLGADIAVTSVVLDALCRRFPRSRIVLVGGRKNYELFAGHPRIEWLAADYGRRASLQERLRAGLRLRAQLRDAEGIVVDPDSRLTQLGLLPVCEEHRYYFFESRCWGGEGNESLSELTRRWAAQMFGIADARPWLRPAGSRPSHAGICVSLGVGENPAKRVPDPFEPKLLAALVGMGLPVLVDAGAGGEEAERVERAVRQQGPASRNLQVLRGSFAAFALAIAGSRLYVGYDSAGQHAAAALGVPVVTVFAGYPSERFFARWQPGGAGPKITVRVASPPDPDAVLEETLQAVRTLLESAGPAQPASSL